MQLPYHLPVVSRPEYISLKVKDLDVGVRLSGGVGTGAAAGKMFLGGKPGTLSEPAGSDPHRLPAV